MFMQNDIESLQIEGIQYKINCTIGQGGAGVVYHVTSSLGDEFALKKIKNYMKNPMLKDAVQSEIKIQKMFSHQKYVINYYGQKVIKNDIYILFELGQFSLRNKIQMNHLVQDQYIQMLIDVASGIKSIHEKKALHRDIKPENIIYSKGIFKVTDFGTSTHNQKTSQMAGTCLYWAPQLLFDEQQQYTQALDIWSFGVLAFQAYFLIHPFFYSKNINSNVKAMQQLKKNIEALTPNFTFQKILNHLRKLGYYQKAQFIENKLLRTHDSLKDCFKGFFVRNPQKRLDINYLLAIFESIQSYQMTRVQIKSSRLINQKQIYPEVDFFIQALNLSYKLNHDFLYKKYEQVEYSLELALRYLSIRDFKGKDFINYHCGEKIVKQQKISQKEYEKIRSSLSQYFFYLKETKELQFFEELAILRVFVILCSCYHIIREKNKSFLRKVSQITSIQMDTLGTFRQMLPGLTERQFASIENFIIAQYFR